MSTLILFSPRLLCSRKQSSGDSHEKYWCEQWRRLRHNEAELDVAISYPVKTVRAKDLTAQVFQLVPNVFPESRSMRDDEADAFRHCLWSAYLASDLGSEFAKRFTDAHENIPSNPENEVNMDLNNNDVGLKIGQVYTGENIRFLGEKCLLALERGELILISPNPGQKINRGALGQ
jgi:hypothetical protein